MKKRELSRGACLLLIVGLLAALLSMAFICAVPNSLQYAVAATGGEAELRRTVKIRNDAAEQLADCASAVTVGAVTETASVTAGDISKTAAVYAVGEGWFEVYPVFMTEGRRLTETELRRGDCVALLDSELAFALFGSELPSDAQITIGEQEYRVTGTVRHRRSVGEAEQHCVYLPLLSDAKARRDTLLIAAKPIANTGAHTMFESQMRSAWRSDGCFYNLQKEALRQMMLPRALLLVFGLGVILALLRGMNRLFSQKCAAYREKLRWNYFKDTLPALLGTIGIGLAGYAAILALLYGLFAFSIQPLTVFTEWVPENFVKWSSLRNVFWSLTTAAAKLVKVGTREMRRLQFWGGILRWSMIAMLSGTLLLRKKAFRADHR